MNLLLFAAAIAITILVFTWLVRVVKATVKTAIIIAAIVFALSFIGIGPDKVTQQVGEIGQWIWKTVVGS
jgi:hypothetical protein